MRLMVWQPRSTESEHRQATEASGVQVVNDAIDAAQPAR
jgi:hypothetical protein